MLTAAASRSHLVFGFGHKVIAGPALKKKPAKIRGVAARGVGKRPTDRCLYMVCHAATFGAPSHILREL